MSDTHDELILRVSPSSTPHAVASALCQAMYVGNDIPPLRAIGAGAVNQAVKSLCIAQGMVGSRGIVLAFRPGFVNVPATRGDGDISAIAFYPFRMSL